jgi:hypothetical protein
VTGTKRGRIEDDRLLLPVHPCSLYRSLSINQLHMCICSWPFPWFFPDVLADPLRSSANAVLNIVHVCYVFFFAHDLSGVYSTLDMSCCRE